MPTRREILEIAARLKQARLALNPNQAQFARKAGLAQNRYNQYESGERTLTLDAAMKLCATYGFTLDWLYRNETALMPHGLIEVLQRAEARP